jgi:hypothetical protein
MAKRRKRARARTRSRAAAPACQLQEIPTTPDFQAQTGAAVELATKSHVGTVLFSKAEYGGKQLVPAGQAVSTISLKVLENRNTLKMVFVFDASISGRGELRENCGGSESHFLRALAGDEPFQFLRIIGK